MNIDEGGILYPPESMMGGGITCIFNKIWEVRQLFAEHQEILKYPNKFDSWPFEDSLGLDGAVAESDPERNSLVLVLHISDNILEHLK